ncbi:MAG: substrate-binding domain-containing protein [Candidatus Eremiobacteraeota bacterium]|nr:substrate-binding domain-containing protein [Candidatus Eremiobacteraeota bacterium]
MKKPSIAALTAASLAAAIAVATGGALGNGTAGAADAKAPVNVGLIYSKTGLLAGYGAEYAEGFAIGLDYATHGTGLAGGHKLVVTERDDAGDPAKAVAAAKDLIGQNTKILAGSTSSGVALQLAPLAAENNVLFISGPAAADAITGNNKFTFRSGRQTYQDVATAAAVVGDLHGKRVLVLAQDTAFGQANFKAVEAVLGTEKGGTVSSLYAPLSASDFAPFAQKIKDAKPDLLFVAWAGATGEALFKTLDDQGVFATTKVVTGLADRASFSTFKPVENKVNFISYYFYQAPKSKANDFLVAALKKQGKVPDLFDPDGFVAAQMIVHAVERADGDDASKTIAALDDWSFEGPKGRETIRASDHAVLQPMFVAKLSGAEPQLVRALESGAVAPPPHPFK